MQPLLPRAFIGYHVRSKRAYSQDNSLAVHGEKEGDYSICTGACAGQKMPQHKTMQG
jgi:hypothetical protein